MKKFVVRLLCSFLIMFTTFTTDILALNRNINDEVNVSIFEDNYREGEVKVEHQNDKKFYIQDFEKKIPISGRNYTYGNGNQYKLIAGREILTEQEYDERQLEKSKSRTLTDNYNDGKGTHLYVEIDYTRYYNGDTNDYFSLDYFYCNSSGSTLSEYYVIYSQFGVRADNGEATTKQAKAYIDTTFKTYSKNVAALGWPGILIGEGVNRIAGVNQFYNCRGYVNNWNVSF